MTIESLHKLIDRDWDKHLRETRRILRVPSVSFTGEGIQESADLMEELLGSMGASHGRYVGTSKSWPLVTGHLDVGAERTALLYGMYDVQPVGDLGEWDSPPFAAKIAKHKRFGDIVVNRGAYNSKASLVGTLLAMKTMVDAGEMPVNVKFLLEGEEELGGLSLPKYVYKNKASLSKADVALGFDYSENSEGVAVISFGMKGCVYFDLIADGKYQGGPEHEIHSSDAVLVKSPVWRLTKALSTMVDEGQVPTVDGLWDSVKKPSKEDRGLIRKLTKRIDIDSYKRDLGVRNFKAPGTKEEILTRYMFEPSLNICGLEAGYYGQGTKTVLPAHAMAKVDIRLVPNMTIKDTRDKVHAHLKRRGFSDIKIVHYEDYPLSKISASEDISKATIAAMKYHGKNPEIWPMTAGSAPYYLFNDVLGIPWGGAGLGHGENAHAPNEFAVVSGMKDFEKSVITTIWKYVEIAGRKKNR